MTLGLIACALAVGFFLGRVRPDRIVDWAEDWTTPGWRTWGFWPAAPVAVACLTLVWVVHPRRTLANVRSWRQDHKTVTVPQYRRPGQTAPSERDEMT